MPPRQIVQRENNSELPRELTGKQADFLRVIRQFIAREGMSPTLAEMAAEAGISKATAQAYVRRLKAAGVVSQRKGKFRTVRLVVAA